jgi:hypothetical protein
MALYTPKADIYTILSGLDVEGLVVYQVRPEILASFPCLTFQVSENSATLELGNEIGVQNIEVTIDIWTRSSADSSELLATLEGAMRENGYRLSFSQDVPNIDLISHIVTRFILVY